MAGHSKWANIKHRKGRQDAKKAKVFTRIGNEISIAVRDNGADPNSNPRLRLALKVARLNSMPGDNIKKAIQRGSSPVSGEQFEEVNFEGYAPGGIAIIVETLTDNKRRTVPQVRSTFSKYNGNLAENGSVMWNFSKKGVIFINNESKSEEDLFNLVIECGGEDLQYNEEHSRIICDLLNFGKAMKFLDENGFLMVDSQIEYIPNEFIIIDDVSEAKQIMKFIEKMEDLDDVQNVYSNFEITDEVAGELE